MIEIRPATAADLNDVLTIETQAFGNEEGPEIANLVNGLLIDQTAMPLLSLLCFSDDRAVGHILFTRAHIADTERPVKAAILAPLAVIPDAQSQGIGGQLIKQGLKQLTDSGVELVFVLGYPHYYQRHGFQPAGILGFEATYSIPEEHADAWMVQALQPGVIGKIQGKVLCADVLSEPEYWRE